MTYLFLVEDDADFGALLQHFLEKAGYRVNWLSSGKAMDLHLQMRRPDLVLLDVQLPGKDGFAIAASLREHYPRVPFLFLTARALKEDQLRGFQLGADDYLIKPVDEDLLLARIEVILRRTRAPAITQLGCYRFESETRTLSHPSGKRHLTEMEAKLLDLLIQCRGQLLSREEALVRLWGRNDFFNRKIMDVYLSKLRRYLSEDECLTIRNIRGQGFILETPEDL